mgnify:CR=1 FL=1
MLKLSKLTDYAVVVLVRLSGAAGDQVADVIAAIDGPIALTACVEGGSCEAEHFCAMVGRWDPVNAAIREALTGISLADMQEAAIPRAFRTPRAAVSLLAIAE